MARLSRVWFGGLAGLVLALGVAGCGGGGPKRANVSGTVLYLGQPVPTGRVTFIGSSDVIESGPIADGKYTIDRAPVGPVKVTVVTPAAPTGIAKKQTQQKVEGMTYSGGSETIVAIPSKYNSAETSGLTYTVTPEATQSYDITLTK